MPTYSTRRHVALPRARRGPPAFERERVRRPLRRSGTRRRRPGARLDPAVARASRSRAAAAGPPSGRFITLMKYGAGAASRNSTVRSSSARTPIFDWSVGLARRGSAPARARARSRSRPTSRARADSARALIPNSTSCAVSGSPSDHVRPSRRWKTYRRPSSAISQRSASDGTIVRSGHCSTSRSNSCMQSWMFGHAIAERGSGSFGQEARSRPAAWRSPVHPAGPAGVQRSNAR